MPTVRKSIIFVAALMVALAPATGICQLNPDAPWPMFHHDIRHTGKTDVFGTQIGKLKWTFVTGGPVTSSHAIDENGIVYVGSTDNNLYAINAEDGTLKWKFQTGGAIDRSSPAIDANGVVYIGYMMAICMHLTQKRLYQTTLLLHGDFKRSALMRQYLHPPLLPLTGPLSLAVLMAISMQSTLMAA